MNSLRLNSAASMSAGALTNNCSITGSVFSASAPQTDGAVGSDGTAMREAVQRGDRGFHQPVAGVVVQVGDQAEPATVLFIGLAIEARLVCRAHLGWSLKIPTRRWRRPFCGPRGRAA